VLFDTELLRWSTAWNGGFVNYEGVAFNGAHGPMPSPHGKIQFGTLAQPGISLTTDFTDPRPREQPYGPLPREEWGHYNGLYRSGDRVVLSYSIGGCDVLELPGTIINQGKVAAFTRTLELSPTEKAISILLADYQPDAATQPATS